MRKKSLCELRSMLIKRLDQQHSEHLSEDEYNEAIASAVAETWDTILNSGLAEQHVKIAPFFSVPNQAEYLIESDDGETCLVTDGDFYKVHAIYVDEGGGHVRELPRINPAELLGFQPPQTAVQLLLYYIPAAPDFKDDDGDWDDECTFDGINGWEELVINTAALAICQKKNDDFSQFYRRKKELEQRVHSMANTDWGQPSRVARRWNRRNHRSNPFLPHTLNVQGWGIRGGNIEIYSGSTGPWV